MLNLIWLLMLVVAVLVAGFTGRLPEMTASALNGAEAAVMKVALPLLGLWAIWLGIMRLAERSGLVHALARAMRPAMRRLFPEVPQDHPAIGAMVMNMSANMIGLGNAATPLGLRAMRLLESLNPQPGTATNAMCVFLTLNTASIQILPLTAISILATQGAQSPTAIVVSAFFATLCAAMAGVVTAKALERLPMFRVTPGPALDDEERSAEDSLESAESIALEKVKVRPFTGWQSAVLWSYFAIFVILFGLLEWREMADRLIQGMHPAWHVPELPGEMAGKGPWVRALMAVSLLAIPFLLSFFPLYAALRGVKVYEQFVVGAKEAWETARRTIPYLVAMLMAIGMLKGAGVIDLLTRWMSPILSRTGFPADLVPMVLMRPLSGSATNGIFVDLVQRLAEPDGFVSRLAGTIYGSTETTFYVLAVYFGSVSIRRTRHAVVAGLTADAVAVIASLIICRQMFA